MFECKPGDIVVYAKQKWSVAPGPRAREVDAAEGGEQYSYVVDKFWRVVGRREDGSLELETRRGKRHIVAEDDPLLRKPNLLEKFRWRHKFPVAEGETRFSVLKAVPGLWSD